MGILESMQKTAKRGTEAASRKAEQVRVKGQVNDLNQRRQNLAAQLGASLFDVVRQTPGLLLGREDIVREMEEIDVEKAACMERLAELEREAQAAQRASTVVRCAKCGAPMHADDRFCGSCGAPASEAMPGLGVTVVVGGPTCPNCGAPVTEGDSFCMSCGKPIG